MMRRAIEERISGRLKPGLSAMNSSTGMSASRAATCTSMSGISVTTAKYGWFGIASRSTPNAPGSAMMFSSAWSFGM